MAVPIEAYTATLQPSCLRFQKCATRTPTGLSQLLRLVYRVDRFHSKSVKSFSRTSIYASKPSQYILKTVQQLLEKWLKWKRLSIASSCKNTEMVQSKTSWLGRRGGQRRSWVGVLTQSPLCIHNNKKWTHKSRRINLLACRAINKEALNVGSCLTLLNYFTCWFGLLGGINVACRCKEPTA